MTDREKAIKTIKNELDPLANDLTEAINEGSEKWLEKQLSRIERAKDMLMELSKEQDEQDFFDDNFGGQF